jgi:hypothetical protein
MAENENKPGCVRITLMVAIAIVGILLALRAAGIIQPALQ